MWQPGRIFKVIGAHRKAARSQVTLLEIPEELRSTFTTPTLSKLERVFARQAARQFAEALPLPVLPEHNTRLWLDRLVFPLGVDDGGHFFETWSYGA